MTAASDQIGDGGTLTVQIPLRLQKRGGRKLLIAPEGATPCVPQWACVDNPMVKAIARAHRWRRLLESGEYATIREIAHAENINETYVGRVLRLTLLAPEIIEAIVSGRQPAGLQLDDLMTSFPVDWQAQSNALHHDAKRPALGLRPGAAMQC